MNLIVSPELYERNRAVVRGEPLLLVRGRFERIKENRNIVVESLESLGPLARSISQRPEVGSSLPGAHHFGRRSDYSESPPNACSAGAAAGLERPEDMRDLLRAVTVGLRDDRVGAIRSFRSTFSGLAFSSADRPDAIVETCRSATRRSARAARSRARSDRDCRACSSSPCTCSGRRPTRPGGRAPVVPDLLADHVLPLRRVVVLRHREVGVVHLRGAPGDVAAGQPDLRHAEPAVLAVLAVAGLDLARDGDSACPPSPAPRRR